MIQTQYSIQGALVRVITDVEGALPLVRLDRYGTVSAAAGGRASRGPGEEHVRLVYRDRRRVSLRWDGRELTFNAPWPLIRSSYALEVLGALAARQALERCDRFVLHASAVSRSGSAVALFGGPGAGKTTAAILLCREHGFRFHSNGSALVGLDGGGRPTVFGTFKQGLKLRWSSFGRMFPAEASRLFGVTAPAGGSLPAVAAPERGRPGFDAKRTVAPADLGLPVETEPRPLAALYHLRLQSGPSRTGPVDPVRFRVALYESLARHVRGAAAFIGFGEGYARSVQVPCLDSPERHAARRELIEAILARVRTEGLVGGPSECAAQVALTHSDRVETSGPYGGDGTA